MEKMVVKMTRFGLYYLNKKIDEIELSSKQYAKKRFFECITISKEGDGEKK